MNIRFVIHFHTTNVPAVNFVYQAINCSMCDQLTNCLIRLINPSYDYADPASAEKATELIIYADTVKQASGFAYQHGRG